MRKSLPLKFYRILHAFCGELRTEGRSIDFSLSSSDVFSCEFQRRKNTDLHFFPTVRKNGYCELFRMSVFLAFFNSLIFIFFINHERWGQIPDIPELNHVSSRHELILEFTIFKAAPKHIDSLSFCSWRSSKLVRMEWYIAHVSFNFACCCAGFDCSILCGGGEVKVTLWRSEIVILLYCPHTKYSTIE